MSKYETGLYIDGEFVSSQGKNTFTLLNPATGAEVAKLPIADTRDVERAVKAAERAQPAWEALSGAERASVLRKWAALVREHTEDINELEAVSMGRPIEGNGDPNACATALEYYAALALNVSGHTSLMTSGQLHMTYRQPFGVCAGIIPWNVPGIMFVYKAGSALAAGNAMIIKTSEKAPLSSLLYAKLGAQAGIPSGVLQVLSGLGDTGRLLSEHMRIRKISFTGSTRTGRAVMQAAAQSNLKNVTLELGGKSPTIIFDDVDIDKVVPLVRFSIFWNAGQICVANSRLYVHEKIHDEFAAKFAESMQDFKHGDPLDPTTTLGPQADSLQSKAVRGFLEIGEREGKALAGGINKTDPKTNFIPPTVFTGIEEKSSLNRDEVFGPVTIIHKFTSEDEVVTKANASEFGLYAAVFSQNIDRCLRVCKRLESGSVGINCTGPTTATDIPFGGYKASGIGRENGPNGLDAYLETKAVFIKVAPQ